MNCRKTVMLGAAITSALFGSDAMALGLQFIRAHSVASSSGAGTMANSRSVGWLLEMDESPDAEAFHMRLKVQELCRGVASRARCTKRVQLSSGEYFSAVRLVSTYSDGSLKTVYALAIGKDDAELAFPQTHVITDSVDVEKLRTLLDAENTPVVLMGGRFQLSCEATTCSYSILNLDSVVVTDGEEFESNYEVLSRDYFHAWSVKNAGPSAKMLFDAIGVDAYGDPSGFLFKTLDLTDAIRIECYTDNVQALAQCHVTVAASGTNRVFRVPETFHETYIESSGAVNHAFPEMFQYTSLNGHLSISCAGSDANQACDISIQ